MSDSPFQLPPGLDPNLWSRILPTLDRLTPEGGRLVPGTRVLVAMSGGVDSSVAAGLLHALGLDVVGVSMQLFDKTGQPSVASDSKCCTLDDFQDARRVAHALGFPHYVLDYRARFREEVIGTFVQDYARGETPSPCIRCNQHLKFDALAETAREVGAAFVVTGHYARILQEGTRLVLRKGLDPHKDQSYFLFAHTPDTLALSLFPLGGLAKPQVRELGRHLGLHLAEKGESQEICFVETGRYDAFLETQGLKAQPGEIVHVEDGRVLGHHEGTWRFTVGQRKGLRIAHPEPLYVIGVDTATARVWVGEEVHLGGLELEAREVSWCGLPPAGPFACRAKIRSRSLEAEAEVEPLGGARARVVFQDPQRAIAPGQAVVFYSGDEVLGGGWITGFETRRP